MGPVLASCSGVGHGHKQSKAHLVLKLLLCPNCGRALEGLVYVGDPERDIPSQR